MMFNVGDFIIYGGNGVCKVDNIGKLKSPDAPDDRTYYTLLPVYAKGRKIFTPVDNTKVIMRPVINEKEALELIDSMKDIDALWLADEKRREQIYKEAFQTCECREMVKIIKTIYLRKRSRLAEGRKVTVGDSRYFQKAEDSLYGELAIALGMDIEQVKEFVIERVEQLEAQEQG